MWEQFGAWIVSVIVAFGGGGIITGILAYLINRQKVNAEVKKSTTDVDMQLVDFTSKRQQEWITRLEANYAALWPEVEKLRKEVIESSERHMECERKLLVIPALEKRIAELERLVANAKTPDTGSGRQP